jgi:hypothetical protein
MSAAPIVTHAGRTPLWLAPGVEYTPETIAKMRGAGSAPGQLWERVAERDALGVAYTDRMERVMRARIAQAEETRDREPGHVWGFSLMRGPSLAGFSTPKVTGFIRAGERVK